MKYAAVYICHNDDGSGIKYEKGQYGGGLKAIDLIDDRCPLWSSLSTRFSDDVSIKPKKASSSMVVGTMLSFFPSIFLRHTRVVAAVCCRRELKCEYKSGREVGQDMGLRICRIDTDISCVG